MIRWVRELIKLQQSGTATIAITIVATRGSVPREAGARMLVTTDAVIGTIGGGHLEYKAIDIARGMLACSEPASVRRFPLGASLGQCCGGLVNLLFEPVPACASWVGELNGKLSQGVPCRVVTALSDDAPIKKLLIANGGEPAKWGDSGLNTVDESLVRSDLDLPQVCTVNGADWFVEILRPVAFRVVLFGAGHVARALVKILGDLECHVTWIDSRQAEFPAALPDNVDVVVSDAPEAELACAQPGDYFLVMTHSHPLDQAITEAILRRGDFAYFGLIGSQTKRRLFEKRLAARGIPLGQLAAMTCPIGGSTISSKEPMAIAVAVATELIVHREQSLKRQHEWRHEFIDETPALARSAGQKWPGSRSSA